MPGVHCVLTLSQCMTDSQTGLAQFIPIFSHMLLGPSVSYTRKWVCDIALIGCTLGLGKKEGSGFQGEGYKGTMGDSGS
jgi:hypothetical protein